MHPSLGYIHPSFAHAPATAMATLGLNEYHSNSIVNYLRFARYRRSQHLRTIDVCSDDLKESRLSDQMFSQDEVADILDDFRDTLKAELESELINATHTNILLLQQMFEQGEKWHLKLQVDISQLENRELLDKIKKFEDLEFDGKNQPSSPFKTKLEPIEQAMGPVELLNLEIQRLNEKNKILTERSENIEAEISEHITEKKKYSEALIKANHALETMQGKDVKSPSSEQIQSIEEQVNKVRHDMEEALHLSSNHQRDLEGDLTSTKHELLEVQSQLQFAEDELEKKFSQTKIYLNIKKMLVKKNEQLKEMRQSLSKYEELSPDD
ncbi:Leucine zipper transcription factor-like protein 1 [Nymphon striatum]|nr:Leucine zipper transcription factor-like protein 1 [Nymphon striatum]